MMRNVPGVGSPRLPGGGLVCSEPPRHVARLGQQEQADLRDVRAGRDVDEVVLASGVERVRAGEVVERAVDLLEVPRVGRFVDDQPHLGLRRTRDDVVAHRLRRAR